MAQTNITFRVDEELKQQFDAFCSDAGVTMTTCITLFVRACVREGRIPFEIRANSVANQDAVLDPEEI